MGTKRQTRKLISRGLKLITSIVFLVIILRVVHVPDIAAHFTSLNPLFTILLLPLSAVVILISCIKWRMLLGKYRHEVSLRSLCGLYLVGYFFSNFLPSMVGGDAARAYLLSQRLSFHKAAYVSVLVERITGLFALIFMVSMLALSNHYVIQEKHLRLPLLLLSSGLIFGLIIMSSRRIFTTILSFLPRRLATVQVKLDRAHKALISFRQDRRQFAVVLLLSLSFHILTGINVYCACRALNCSVSIVDIVLITPLIILASLLPLSMNGIGLWEGSFVLFLGLAGVPQSVAISAALLLRLKTLIVSGMGWAVYFTYKHQPGGDNIRKEIESSQPNANPDN
jgi:uncharacterized protein (TIRG00374 family)